MKDNKKKKKKNERENIVIDSTDMRRIIQECYEQLYVLKFDNLGEMDKCLKDMDYQSPLKKEQLI